MRLKLYLVSVHYEKNGVSGKNGVGRWILKTDFLTLCILMTDTRNSSGITGNYLYRIRKS